MTRVWSCTRGMTAVPGHTPRHFPGALFNPLHLSIIFLKPVVPRLSEGLLVLETQRPVCLPAVGRVSTRGVGLGLKSPRHHRQHQLIPASHSTCSSWPKREAEPGVTAKNEVCPWPVVGGWRCCRSPSRAAGSDTELWSLSYWSSTCRQPRAEVSAACICGALGQPHFPSKNQSFQFRSLGSAPQLGHGSCWGRKAPSANPGGGKRGCVGSAL